MLSNCGAREELGVPWAERWSNQSILKAINPEYSLEGLMLKLKVQYFGHLMWPVPPFSLGHWCHTPHPELPSRTAGGQQPQQGKQMANAHVAAVQSLANTLSKCQFVADTVTGQRPHLSSSSPAGPLKRKLRICLPFAHTRRAVVGRHWVLQGPPHGQLGLRQDLPQQTCHH